MRDGFERQQSVTLGEQPGERSETRRTNPGTSAERVLDGVSLESVTPEFSNRYGLGRNAKGVVVRRVDPNSAAAEAGLEQGDVILEANRQPVATVDQLNRYINEATSDAALLLVIREGRTRYVVISTK